MSESLAGFAAQLEELRSYTDLSKRSWAKAADLRPTTVADLLSGERTRPPSWEMVKALVIAAVKAMPEADAGHNGTRRKMLSNLEWWHDQLVQLRENLKSGVRPPLALPAAGQDMALEIRKPVGEVALRSWRDRMPYWNKKYARRDNLHTQIKLAAETNHRIALVGLPGFGKTHLAAEVSAELAGERHGEAVWLRGDNLDNLMKGVRSELQRRGRKGTHEGTRLLHEFADLVDTSPTPLIVLVDDVTDAALLDDVLPHVLGTPVIATMRRRLVDPALWHCVTIDELSDDQAFVLARDVLPARFPDQEVRRLVAALAGYPLAIESAAALLRNHSDITLDEFCAELERDVVRMLSISEKRDKALAFIYRTLLKHLEREDLSAARLLAIVALLKQNQVSRSTLHGVFRTIPAAVEDAAADEYDFFGFVEATDRLAEYSFVSVTGDDEVGIHQLVRELVAQLGLDRHRAMGLAAAMWLRHEVKPYRSLRFESLSQPHALVSPVINAADPDKVSDEDFDLLGQLLVAAAQSAAPKGLPALKDNWLFRRALQGSGRTDPRIGALQHRLLMVAERDHDPLVLVHLTRSRYLGSSMTPHRKAVVADQAWATKSVDRQNLLLSVKSDDTTHVVEPLSNSINIGRDAMRNGLLDAANGYGSQPLQTTATAPTLARAHLLLTRIALRRPNLPKAVHHIEQLRVLYDGHGADPSKLPNVAHGNLLEGELAYAQFLSGQQKIENVRHFYELAVQRFAPEVFGVGRFEAERKLHTTRAFTDFDAALTGLHGTLAATASPILLPVHYRTAISIAKLGCCVSSLSGKDIDECWRAAEFFSTSEAFDRYWYAEALLTLCLASPTSRSVREAAVRELTAIGRSDKIELLDQPAGNVDARPLLLD